MLIFLTRYDKSSVVAEMGDHLATKKHNLGAAVPLSSGGELGPIKHNVAWAEICLRIKWHLHPSSHFATVDMGQKVGGAVPLSGVAESVFNTMSPRRGLSPYQMVPSSIQPFGLNRHGPKIRDCAPLGGNWVPM